MEPTFGGEGGYKFGRERLLRQNEKIFCYWWGCSHLPTNIECSYINSNEEKLLRINIDFQLLKVMHHLSAKKLVKSYKMSYERCLLKVVLVKRCLMKAFAGNNLESKGSIWKNKKGHLEL